MKTQEQIRRIWMEMKELENIRKGIIISDISNQSDFEKRTLQLEKKYEEIEIQFGHESTLLKAVIFYLNQKQEILERELEKLL